VILSRDSHRENDGIASICGFTLIELLVVLAIAAFVAALVVPRLASTTQRTAVRSAARELEAALRATRSIAMAQGRPQALIIDTSRGAFQQGSKAGHLPGGIHLVLTTTTGDRLNAQTGRIRFFPDGTSTGGGIDIWAGNDRNQVLVDWLSGRVSIEEGSHAPSH
jgi:general secretion pathway protein H